MPKYTPGNGGGRPKGENGIFNRPKKVPVPLVLRQMREVLRVHLSAKDIPAILEHRRARDADPEGWFAVYLELEREFAKTECRMAYLVLTNRQKAIQEKKLAKIRAETDAKSADLTSKTDASAQHTPSTGPSAKIPKPLVDDAAVEYHLGISEDQTGE